MRRTLGITLASRRPGEAAIGWALLEPARKPKIHSKGNRMITGDPVLAALDMATRHPGVPVDLKRYANAAAFHGSLPQREGQTLAEHHEIIERTAELLRSHDVDVSIDVIGG